MSRFYGLLCILETGSGLVCKRVHIADETRQNCLVSNILRTTENCRRLSHYRRRQRRDTLVLSCPRLRCKLARHKSQIYFNVAYDASRGFHVTSELFYIFNFSEILCSFNNNIKYAKLQRPVRLCIGLNLRSFCRTSAIGLLYSAVKERN